MRAGCLKPKAKNGVRSDEGDICCPMKVTVQTSKLGLGKTFPAAHS